jgi:hypothetical protein
MPSRFVKRRTCAPVAKADRCAFARRFDAVKPWVTGFARWTFPRSVVACTIILISDIWRGSH